TPARGHPTRVAHHASPGANGTARLVPTRGINRIMELREWVTVAVVGFHQLGGGNLGDRGTGVGARGVSVYRSGRMSSGLEDRFQTLHEIVQAARRELAPGPWDYLVGGTETETTLRRTRQALDSVAFRPRVLRAVGAIDMGGPWLGQRVRPPVMLAPIGSIESFTPGGAATAAKAAARFGIPQMLSSACNPGL